MRKIKKIRIAACLFFITAALSACAKKPAEPPAGSETGTLETTAEENSSPESTTTEVADIANMTDVDKRTFILSNDHTSETRNKLLIEDIEYFKVEMPKHHINAFHSISEDEFQERVDNLITRIPELNNQQVFVELNKITTAIGDAHTGFSYFDGYIYPVMLYSFGDDIYVVNADKSLEDILYAKVVAVNGHDIAEIKEQLTLLIPHENDIWLKNQLPGYLRLPVFLYGLNLIPDEEKTMFTFEKEDGSIIEKELTTLSYGVIPDFIISNGKFVNSKISTAEHESYYWYEFLEDEKTLYFKYNVCADMDQLSFEQFNQDMFDSLDGKEIHKVVIDLRHNSGGDSSILYPFIESMAALQAAAPDLKIYALSSRQTYSSGMMAITDMRKDLDLTVVGEPTGGSPNSYGDILSFELPNTKLQMMYSTKYFQLTDDNADTIVPDVLIEYTMEDFLAEKDAAMEYVRQD